MRRRMRRTPRRRSEAWVRSRCRSRLRFCCAVCTRVHRHPRAAGTLRIFVNDKPSGYTFQLTRTDAPLFVAVSFYKPGTADLAIFTVGVVGLFCVLILFFGSLTSR